MILTHAIAQNVPLQYRAGSVLQSRLYSLFLNKYTLMNPTMALFIVNIINVIFNKNMFDTFSYFNTESLTIKQ